MEKCNICPRKCNIDRTTTCGFCGAKTLKVAKVMKHYWEEPIISGANGSGAIFFSHCSLKCLYCQNFEISHEGLGEEITIQDLANIFKDFDNSNVHNINLVSPTHYTNEIISALKIYKPSVPIVWNTSGYEDVETIKKLKPYVDIYLTDLKYFDSQLSKTYSQAENYFKVASQSILEMKKNQPNDIIENGIMKKGVIIRHLILPSHTSDSIKILNWIRQNLGTEQFVSIMRQYTPCYKATTPPLNRKLTQLEYKRVIMKFIELGFENGFSQDEESASTEFIPEFKKS